MGNINASSSFSRGQFWRGKRAFVTGATGFLGSWIVEELVTQGAEVVALVRDIVPSSRFFSSEARHAASIVRGRLEDLLTLERIINEYEIDTIFHLGAQAIVGTAVRSPRSTFEANVRGTWNVLEAARMHRAMVKRIIVVTSDKVYGEKENLPYREDDPLEGKNPYDASKRCADIIAQSYWHTYQLPLCISRCGNMYGGGDVNFSRIIPGTIRAILQGEQPVIRSDGTLTRDYLYIKDSVHAHLTLAERMHRKDILGHAFNFANSKRTPVYDVVRAIMHLMKAEGDPLILNEAENEISHQHLSIEKAERMLGWRPRYSLEEGLQEAIPWYERYIAQQHHA